MKYFLISHIKDVDGVSPIILLNLCKVDFDYKLLEISDLDTYIEEFLNTDLSCYENIYITDLSLSKKSIDLILNSPYKNKFVSFDHHKSNLFANEYDFITVDIDECGTSLFYKYLKKKYDLTKNIISQYVEHVLNLDIWLWVKKEDYIAKDLGNLHVILGNDEYIDVMTKKLIEKESFSFSDLEEALLKIENERFNRYALKKKEELVIYNYEDKKVGVVFAESYKSELGHYLFNEITEIAFVVMINMAGGVSLRTESEEVDLSCFASKFGGGGHQKASGLKIEEAIKELVVNKIFNNELVKVIE